MLPKVLCLLAIAAFAASAPYDDQQYIQQLQKEYGNDRYDDQETDNFGKLQDDSEQFEDHTSGDMEQIEEDDDEMFGQKEDDVFDKQTSELKDVDQFDKEENIEQDYQSTGDELKEMEQVEQVETDQGIENENENIEHFDQTTGDVEKETEQVEQTDDYWNQHDDIDRVGGGEIEQEQQLQDDLETQSMLGKLFGNGEQEPDDTYGSFEPAQKEQTQEKQLPEVGREYGYNQDMLPKEEVVEQQYVPVYEKQSYGSAKANEFYTPEPYETEVYTTKKTPWYKRVWGKTKDTARKVAHKVKETFGK